jgi:hypothetical protein
MKKTGMADYRLDGIQTLSATGLPSIVCAANVDHLELTTPAASCQAAMWTPVDERQIVDPR